MAVNRIVTKVLAGLEDILTGVGTVIQERGGANVTITKINASNLSYDSGKTIREKLGLKVEVVTNIAALKAILTGTEEEIYIEVLGYNTAGDGGGGIFYLDTTDTVTAEDGILVFEPDDLANGRWKRIDTYHQVSDDNGDANLVLTAYEAGIQIFDTTLTANRTVTLPASGLFNGQRFRIVRSAGGNFTLDVGSIKIFPKNTKGYVEVAYNGTTWVVVEYGWETPEQYIQQTLHCTADSVGGTVNAITATFNPAISALVDNLEVRVRTSGPNTTSTPTLKVDSLSAKDIVKFNNQTVTSSELAGDALLRYNLSLDKWILLNPVQSSEVVGSEKFWPTSVPPTGWLEEDGSEISRTTYAALFAVIGTTFGEGNGTTTFNLPDSRGQFIRGWDHGRGLDPDAASRTAHATGAGTGDVIGSLQTSANKSHSHNMFENDTTFTSTAPGAADSVAFQSSTSSNNDYSIRSNGAQDTYIPDIGETSDSGGNESRPTNSYRMMIIKY